LADEELDEQVDDDEEELEEPEDIDEADLEDLGDDELLEDDIAVDLDDGDDDVVDPAAIVEVPIPLGASAFPALALAATVTMETATPVAASLPITERSLRPEFDPVDVIVSFPLTPNGLYGHPAPATHYRPTSLTRVCTTSPPQPIALGGHLLIARCD